ncbi:MAG: acyl-CoA thioesterase [Kofleriaceae bacterium]
MSATDADARSLDELTRPTRVATGEGRATFSLDVPAGWRQGRGAFGGLCIASLVRAIEATVADPARRVRSVTAELPGPVDAGAADIAVEILRAGNAVTTARAVLSQANGIKSHAVAVVAATRKSADAAWQDLAPPSAPAWSELAAVPDLGFPEFARHFEYRIVEGIPGSSGASRAIGWVRARDPGAARDSAYIAAMCDVWWPASLVRFDRMRPAATIAYTLDIVGTLEGLDPEAPLLYRGVVPVMRDGYFLETRELWGSDGRLIAVNHQTFALLG